MKEVNMIKEELSSDNLVEDDLEPLNFLRASPYSKNAYDSNNPMVGFEAQLMNIKGELTESSSQLKVIWIVGMGGIGKTTLAANAHNDPSIVSRFDIRAWATISQSYCLRDTLFAILESMNRFTNKKHQESDDELGYRIHKILKGRRYLITLDDVWDTNAWDEVNRFLPKDGNESRVMLTTRQQYVADYFGSSNRTYHKMLLLNDDQSWRLLSSKIFGKEESCHPDFQDIGKKIAQNCRGLPLSIVVVGRLLSKMNMTLEAWQDVARKTTSVVISGDDRCLEILRLSYDYLPQRLKACLLYTGVFPEDYEISVSKITKLWVAEGFLEQVHLRCPEEVAESCLEELINHNLIIVSKRNFEGKIKRFKIHDLLLDFCVKEANNEKFLQVIKWYGPLFPGSSTGERRISIHPMRPQEEHRFSFNSSEPNSFARSLIMIGKYKIPSNVFRKFKMLNVFDALEVEFLHFPSEILELVGLRYVGFIYKGEVPASISRLSDLQTLIIHQPVGFDGPVYLPVEIWTMVQLRHLEFTRAYFREQPSSVIGEGNHVVLEDLQTISGITNLVFTEQMLKIIPNIKKLEIMYDISDHSKKEWSYYHLENLVNYQQLIELKIKSNLTFTRYFLRKELICLPLTLRLLTLFNCAMSWDELTMVVGSLPKLEVLKLEMHFSEEDDWKPNAGEFCQLRVLILETTKLKRWVADSDNFPKLEILVIQNCYDLLEIPQGFGEIDTLTMIGLDYDCHASLLASAKKIQEAQRSSGNDDFQILGNSKPLQPMLQQTENIESFSGFLQVYEHSSHKRNEEMTRLQQIIRDAAYESRDIGEIHILNNSMDVNDDVLNVGDTMKEVDSLNMIEELSSDKTRFGNLVGDDLKPSSSLPALGSSKSAYDASNSMAGFEAQLMNITDELTGSSSQLRVISIVGMGGIGKTTLAAKAHNNTSIVSRFDIRAWATISQSYCTQNIMLGILESMNKLTDEMRQESDDQLQERLHKFLNGRRYLITLDDVWDTNAWDEVNRVLPRDDNGSRIMLTTRLNYVADYVSSNRIHQMSLLRDDQSWSLLSAKIFGRESCPRKFQDTGKEIAQNCRGLPLSIVVVGGLLSRINRTVEAWKDVAENTTSVVTSGDDRCLQILKLSYDYLPQGLKACLLYTGVFPEDYEISVSKITKLWVAEGFLEQVMAESSLEEVAESSLEELINRNLIIVSKRNFEGKIERFKIHDLLLDLCVKEAKKERFLQVMKWYVGLFPGCPTSQCRISIHPMKGYLHFLNRNSARSDSFALSLMLMGEYKIHSDVFPRFKLLQVLDAIQVNFHKFPYELFELVSLRYLAFMYEGEVPSEISRLLNLQTLIIHQPVHSHVYLPVEIWNMVHLRHLEFTSAYFRKEPSFVIGESHVVLKDLQTISGIRNLILTEELLTIIPNIKKLEIEYDILGIKENGWPYYHLENLLNLRQLEELEIDAFLMDNLVNPQQPILNVSSLPKVMLPQFSLPHTLRVLTLSGWTMSHDGLTMVGLLPNLKVLKLKNHDFQGHVWELNAVEFCQLKVLILEWTNLKHWEADSENFPKLEILVIQDCYDLIEIPQGFAESGTLTMIELDEKCTASVLTSARQIQDSQRSSGYEDFQIIVSEQSLASILQELMEQMLV